MNALDEPMWESAPWSSLSVESVSPSVAEVPVPVETKKPSLFGNAVTSSGFSNAFSNASSSAFPSFKLDTPFTAPTFNADFGKTPSSFEKAEDGTANSSVMNFDKVDQSKSQPLTFDFGVKDPVEAKSSPLAVNFMSSSQPLSKFAGKPTNFTEAAPLKKAKAEPIESKDPSPVEQEIVLVPSLELQEVEKKISKVIHQENKLDANTESIAEKLRSLKYNYGANFKVDSFSEMRTRLVNCMYFSISCSSNPLSSESNFFFVSVFDQVKLTST
jgi:hypothetical protein